jgi:hypothetical protein
MPVRESRTSRRRGSGEFAVSEAWMTNLEPAASSILSHRLVQSLRELKPRDKNSGAAP